MNLRARSRKELMETKAMSQEMKGRKGKVGGREGSRGAARGAVYRSYSGHYRSSHCTFLLVSLADDPRGED